MHAQKTSTKIEVVIFFFFLRMLAPAILAEIMQHAKLALHIEIISVCVLLDLDLKATIVIKVRNPINFLQHSMEVKTLAAREREMHTNPYI